MAKFDPGAYEVPELGRRLEDVDDPGDLRALLAAERLGSDRAAAKAAIKDRLAALDADAASTATVGGTDGSAAPGGGTDVSATTGDVVVPTVAVDWRLRTRLLLSDRFRVAVVVLVLAALAGGWLAYTTHVEPGTHVEERTVVVFERTVGFEHGATVHRSNSLFPVGTRISDRGVYFTAIAPELDGSVAVTYDSPHADPVELTTRLTLVTRSVGRGGDAETVYWSVSEPLAPARTATVVPGETVRTRFSVNVSEVDERAERIRDELGTSLGRTEAVVVADLRFAGTVDGRTVDTTADYPLRIEPGGGTYEVIEPEAGTETVRATERVPVENSYGPLRSAAGPVLLAGSFVGLVFLLYGRIRGGLAVTEREREALAFAATRAEFDEWITRGHLPADLREPVVRTASLEGLVDVAIDTNERVIHDPRTGRYAVLDGSVTYLFERSPADEG